MKIPSQLLLFFVATVVAWYGMMAMHEGGHCLGALLSGGVVESVKIPLLGFSQTQYADLPHPQLTTWSGPLGGSLFALAPLLCRRRFDRRYQQLSLYFAGFCLIANGLYLGLGLIERAGDCGDLLNHGAQSWQLVFVGAGLTAVGAYCWHRMGPLGGWFGGGETCMDGRTHFSTRYP